MRTLRHWRDAKCPRRRPVLSVVKHRTATLVPQIAIDDLLRGVLAQLALPVVHLNTEGAAHNSASAMTQQPQRGGPNEAQGAVA